MDDIDQSWGKELRSKLPPLMDDAQKQEFHQHLVRTFILSKPEADTCIDALAALKNNERSLASDVLMDNLPEEMKTKFRQMAVDDLMSRLPEEPKMDAAPAAFHPTAPKR